MNFRHLIAQERIMVCVFLTGSLNLIPFIYRLVMSLMKFLIGLMSAISLGYRLLVQQLKFLLQFP